MVGRRRYDDGCPVALGLDLVGERWALLVARELVLGPKRFTDLRAGLPGISADVLTQRLRDLEDCGVVCRRKLPSPAAAWIYELTEWGAGLEPVLAALARWALSSPSVRPGAGIGVDSLVLALKVLFDPDAARALDLLAALRLDDGDFHVRISEGEIEVGRGVPDRFDLRLECSPDTLAALLQRQRALPEVLQTGELELTGGRRTAERFLNSFPLPGQLPVA
jgi:DNA-binding HxlR family transcriptional regulator